MTSTSSSGDQLQKSLLAALQGKDRRNEYVTHLKVYERQDDADVAPGAQAQRKTRYIILGADPERKHSTMYKSKRNANGSFSIGKEWDLTTLRELRLEDGHQVTIGLARSYRWQADKAQDPVLFLRSMAYTFQQVTGKLPAAKGWDMQAAMASLPLPRHEAEAKPAPTRQPVVPVGGATQNQASRAAHLAPTAQSSQPQPAPAVASAASSPEVHGSALPYEQPGTPSPAMQARTLDSAAGSAGPAPTKVQPAAPQPSHAPASSPAPAPAPAPAPSRVPPPTASRPPAPSPAPAPTPASASAPSTTQARPAPALNMASPNFQKTAPSARNERTAEQLRPAPSAAPAPSPTRAPAPARTPAPAPAPSPSADRTPQAAGNAAVRQRANEESADARSRLSAIEPARGGAAYERMLLEGTGLSGIMEYAELGDDVAAETKAAGGEEVDRKGVADVGVARETNAKPEARAVVPGETTETDENPTLAHVEEMLEGFDFRNTGAMAGKRTQGGVGTADAIEVRLLEELAALESSGIHSMIESDDRVVQIVQHIEDALASLDQLDGMVATYKMQLNARAEDIAFIEGQNRGLQVQTSNQRLLLQEIETLLSTINVDDQVIRKLATANVGVAGDVGDLETAAASLYKSILQARPERKNTGATEIAATTERLQQYASIGDRFSLRLLQGIVALLDRETSALLADPQRAQANSGQRAVVLDHAQLEQVLGRYCGLMLYMKETSPELFTQLGQSYFTSMSKCYGAEMHRVFGAWRAQLRSPMDDDENEIRFAPSTQPRARRAPGMTSRRPGEVSPSEALEHLVASIVPCVLREQAFLADLLHIQDGNVTFADYMDLEPYFRRRAHATWEPNVPQLLRDMRLALEAVFGFVSEELQSFVSYAASGDRTSLLGLAATMESAVRKMLAQDNDFLKRILTKVHARVNAELDGMIAQHIRDIEATKLTVRKRKGIVHFITVFPLFVERVESQLHDADDLRVRVAVNEAYTRIGRSMFSVLQSISKMDGVGSIDEDKGQLNHFVILIENMYHLLTHVPTRSYPSPALRQVVDQAQSLYSNSLASYVQTVLRRPLGKMMDFCGGVDALLQSTPANEVTLHSAYSKSALKKLTRDYGPRDVRKAIDTLAKRVQKHFGEDDEGNAAAAQAAGLLDRDEMARVQAEVWKAAEDGFAREIERLSRIIRTCYAETSGQLEVSSADVRRLFHQSPPGTKRR